MPGDAADRLRKVLEAKRMRMDEEAARKSAEVERRRGELEQLIQQVSSIVGPVFAAAEAVFREKEYSATFRDELRLKTVAAFPRMHLTVEAPGETLVLTAHLDQHSGEVAFTINERDAHKAELEDRLLVDDLDAEYVWSQVEKLGERMP